MTGALEPSRDSKKGGVIVRPAKGVLARFLQLEVLERGTRAVLRHLHGGHTSQVASALRRVAL